MLELSIRPPDYFVFNTYISSSLQIDLNTVDNLHLYKTDIVRCMANPHFTREITQQARNVESALTLNQR